MKKLLFLFAAAGLVLAGCDEPEPEPIPPTPEVDVLDLVADPVFNNYCLSQMSEWDVDGNGKLSPEEAALVKRIDVGNEDSWEGERVASPEGIENFTGLVELYCHNTEITSLDVSACTALVYLNCRSCALTELNVSGCSKIERLWCLENNLTALDVSNLGVLNDLSCNDNALAALDVSRNFELEFLNCWNNSLSSIDISSCRKLLRFQCGGNPGDGETFTVVNALFDNGSIPSGFTMGDWKSDGKTIAVDYKITVAD